MLGDKDDDYFAISAQQNESEKFWNTNMATVGLARRGGRDDRGGWRRDAGDKRMAFALMFCLDKGSQLISIIKSFDKETKKG
jgi:hypothetical protein